MILVQNFMLVNNHTKTCMCENQRKQIYRSLKFSKILRNHHKQTHVELYYLFITMLKNSCKYRTISAMQTWFSYAQGQKIQLRFALQIKIGCKKNEKNKASIKRDLVHVQQCIKSQNTNMSILRQKKDDHVKSHKMLHKTISCFQILDNI